jgi:hypothetical protein
MPELARFARRFRFLRLLRASLVLGAAYDAGFAALMVAAPRHLAAWFAVPLPPRLYLWLLAVVLLMLAAFYLLAAKDPRRYSGTITVAIGGRLAGAAALGLAALLDPRLAGLWGAAAADAGFGVAHLLLWRPVR